MSKTTTNTEDTATKTASGDTTESVITEKTKAGYPALYMISAEDQRSIGEIKRAAKNGNRKAYVWTFGKGLADESGKVAPDTETPPAAIEKMMSLPPKSIVILRHFHHFMEDPQVQAGLLDLIPQFKVSQKMLVILTPVLRIPLELEKEVTLVETKLPDKAALGKVLDGILTASKITGDKAPDEETREKLLEAARGLTTSEAESALSLSYVRPKMKNEKLWDPSVVMNEKCAALRKSGLLTYYPPGKEGMGQMGGMEILKHWVSKRKSAFTDDAAKFGLPFPKGILLVGPPGAGKSLGAKAISEELGLALLRCDMGRIFAGLVGASEENARRVIQIAEAVAPCVLWLDEIEKGFAGASGNGSLDSGVGARVLGTILTWMQEKTEPVFIYATANNVDALPPELLRKGRFDEIFAVHLPSQKEREDIFRIHIAKRGREKLLGKKIDVKSMAKNCKGFTGAEIEAVINDALFSAFSAGKDLNSVDIEEAIKHTKPLSEMMKPQIDRMVEWCKGRARSANEPSDEDVVMQISGESGRALDA